MTDTAAQPLTGDGIVVQGLVKTWRGPGGPVRAVRGIDVTIGRDETVALLGLNGAGKSTTIDMLLGLTRPEGAARSRLGSGRARSARRFQTCRCTSSPSSQASRPPIASLPVRTWLEMTGLMIVGLMPFAALGIVLGHVLNVDAIGPATGGVVSLLALVSGAWFPVTHGFLHDLGQLLPSYWLVQAGRVSLHGHGWGTMGWTVVLAWTAVLAGLSALVYRRDTGRV